MPEYITPAFSGNPEAFMRKNIVIQKVRDSAKPGLMDVVIIAVKGYAIINSPGGIVCMMAPKPADVSESMRIYWCPYEQNGIKSVMLGSDALYAFTPTMNGCSVGLGSHGGGGNQQMAHVNAGRVGKDWEAQGMDVGRARQASSQHAQLTNKLGHDSTIIQPEDYRLNGHGEHQMESTTHASHAFNGAWNLYTQTYRKAGSKTYYHGGLSGPY